MWAFEPPELERLPRRRRRRGRHRGGGLRGRGRDGRNRRRRGHRDAQEHRARARRQRQVGLDDAVEVGEPRPDRGRAGAVAGRVDEHDAAREVAAPHARPGSAGRERCAEVDVIAVPVALARGPGVVAEAQRAGVEQQRRGEAVQARRSGIGVAVQDDAATGGLAALDERRERLPRRGRGDRRVLERDRARCRQLANDVGARVALGPDDVVHELGGRERGAHLDHEVGHGALPVRLAHRRARPRVAHAREVTAGVVGAALHRDVVDVDPRRAGRGGAHLPDPPGAVRGVAEVGGEGGAEIQLGAVGVLEDPVRVRGRRRGVQRVGAAADPGRGGVPRRRAVHAGDVRARPAEIAGGSRGPDQRHLARRRVRGRGQRGGREQGEGDEAGADHRAPSGRHPQDAL